MNESCYENVKMFKNKFPHSVTWFRLKKHCAVVEKHLNPDEQILFAFGGQLDNINTSFFNTGVLVLTSQRLIVAQNRFFIGYKFSSITPDLYNDMQVSTGIFWGTLCIDTVKEKIYVSKLDKKSLPEIETYITMYMQETKKQYYSKDDDES